MKGAETSTPRASPSGPTKLGEPLGRVAEAAAEVEHAVAGARRVGVHRRLAVGAEAAVDELAELR